jgi:hypothetical protein
VDWDGRCEGGFGTRMDGRVPAVGAVVWDPDLPITKDRGVQVQGFFNRYNTRRAYVK